MIFSARAVRVVLRKTLCRFHEILESDLYPTPLEVAFFKSQEMKREFCYGRREFRFPTIAIRRSLLQTSGVQLRRINRCRE